MTASSPRASLIHAAPRGQRKSAIDDMRDANGSQCAQLMRRTLRTLELKTAEFAESIGVSQAQVSRMLSFRSRQALTIAHLMIASDAVFDLVITGIVESRSRNGHGKRRLIAVEDERSPERERRSAKLVAAVDALEPYLGELRAIANLMRGGE